MTKKQEKNLNKIRYISLFLMCFLLVLAIDFENQTNIILYGGVIFSILYFILLRYYNTNSSNEDPHDKIEIRFILVSSPIILVVSLIIYLFAFFISELILLVALIGSLIGYIITSASSRNQGLFESKND